MHCIIVEDQPPAQRILKKYIEDMASLALKATFTDALQAMDFLKVETVDLIFLDIHLPKISGIDFLKTLAHPPAIILTTAFPDYALESYELDVVDYLLKPFSFQRFVKAVSKVPVQQPSSPGTADSSPRKDFFIKSGYELIKIAIEDIDYIKSDADYTELMTAHKKHLSAEPLRYWLGQLPDNQFVRIHKSFIINTKRIERIVGNQLYLIGRPEAIPIGRTYKEPFINRFVK
ncbi:MAG: LytTR family DNA-binding domain-containing protein [Bacteroidota bacterium]